jgi:hypothetical protein
MRVDAMGSVLALNLVLAGALAYLWSDDERSRWSEPDPLPPALEDVAAAKTAEPVDISRYRETVERPLFAPTRKVAPRSGAGGEGQDAVDPFKDIRLLGTYGAGGQGGIIVLRDGKVQRVAIGASIGEWKVAGEEGRGVALVRGSGERRQLGLTLNTVAPSAPAAAGRTGTPESAAGQAAVPGAPPAATSQAAAAGPARAEGDAAREQLRRQRLERINARRAQRGLPPLSE